jgi:hypothetical protein
LYSSLDIVKIKSRRLRWTGHVALSGETRKPYKILTGKSEGKRLDDVSDIKMSLNKTSNKFRNLITWTATFHTAITKVLNQKLSIFQHMYGRK